MLNRCYMNPTCRFDNNFVNLGCAFFCACACGHMKKMATNNSFIAPPNATNKSCLTKQHVKIEGCSGAYNTWNKDWHQHILSALPPIGLTHFISTVPMQNIHMLFLQCLFDFDMSQNVDNRLILAKYAADGAKPVCHCGLSCKSVKEASNIRIKNPRQHYITTRLAEQNTKMICLIQCILQMRNRGRNFLPLGIKWQNKFLLRVDKNS